MRMASDAINLGVCEVFLLLSFSFSLSSSSSSSTSSSSCLGILLQSCHLRLQVSEIKVSVGCLAGGGGVGRKADAGSK